MSAAFDQGIEDFKQTIRTAVEETGTDAARDSRLTVACETSY